MIRLEQGSIRTFKEFKVDRSHSTDLLLIENHNGAAGRRAIILSLSQRQLSHFSISRPIPHHGLKRVPEVCP